MVTPGSIFRELRCVNPEWLITIEVAMLTHYHDLSPANMGQGHKILNAASVYFCFAVALLLAEVAWWPKSFSKPPRIFCIMYQAILANVLTNMVMHYVFIPVTEGFKRLLKEIINILSKCKNSLITSLIACLKKPSNICILIGILCFLFIILALYIAERLECIKSFIKRLTRRLKHG